MMIQGDLSFTEEKQITEGYKKTAIGLIPNDWTIQKLGELFEPSITRMKLKSDDSVAFVGMQDVSESAQLITQKVVKFHEVKSGFTFFGKGDVLVAKITPCFENGKGCITDNLITDVGFGSTEFHVLRANQNSISKFIYYWTVNSTFRNKLELDMVGSAGHRRVPLSSIQNYLIPLPATQAEQQKIATALSDTDALISELEKLIEKKQAIKIATMQQLLTGKTRLPEFALREDGMPKAYKDSELGQIPEDWEIKQLGEFVEITSGESPSKFDFVNNGIPYFKVEQLNNGNFYAQSTPYYVKLGKTISAGSLVFPKRGASILSNKIRILKVDACMDTNLMALTCDPELNPNYLLYALTYSGLDKVADTTSIPQINNKHVLPYKIFYPSLIEQVRISNILVNLENDIELSEQKVEKLRKIKLGMMQGLLTGKTRLV